MIIIMLALICGISNYGLSFWTVFLSLSAGYFLNDFVNFLVDILEIIIDNFKTTGGK